MVYYIKYKKVKDGWKADNFSKVFKTLNELKYYFERTSSVKVKFIKG